MSSKCLLGKGRASQSGRAFVQRGIVGLEVGYQTMIVRMRGGRKGVFGYGRGMRGA